MQDDKIFREIEKIAETGIEVHNSGVSVFPKADGRVEIPQFVVRAMGWEKTKKIYITNESVGVCIYANNVSNETIGVSFSSAGRLRIPAGALKKTNFFRKSLVFVIERNRVVARPRAESKDVREGLINLFSAFVPQKEIKEPAEEKHKEKVGEPELILLNTNKSTMFHPVNNPFQFMASFSNSRREIVFGSEECNNFRFFLIPGIKRSGDSFQIGFLLLNSQTYSALAIKVISAGLDKEFMFWPNQKESGGFMVVAHPPSSRNTNEIVELAKKICEDPKSILETHFRKMNTNNDVYSTPPAIIAQQTINLMCPKEEN
jgi:hypothetical protein